MTPLWPIIALALAAIGAFALIIWIARLVQATNAIIRCLDADEAERVVRHGDQCPWNLK